MQDLGYGLSRISLPHTPVKKGMKKAQKGERKSYFFASVAYGFA
jgi:hypothetical protein